MSDKTPQEIAEDFLSRLKASPFVMVSLDGSGQHAEPLTAQVDDDQPDVLYFFTGRDNRVAPGGKATAQFASKGHDFFACLAGTITPDNDRAQIDKLWSKPVEAWFPGGKDDPNLTLLRFDITSAELWESDLSLGGMFKMLFGGTIRRGEEGSHAVVDEMTAAQPQR